MTQRLSKSRKISALHSERGAYLVMMTMGSILFLAFAGLAIDGANYYHQKVALEKALDAGALAALAYRVEIGPDNAKGTGGGDIKTRARKVAILNVERNMGWALRAHPNPANFKVSYNYTDETLSLTGAVQINLFLMNSILWGLESTSNHPGEITATSRARIAPANIALVLDYSNSMNCSGIAPCNYSGLNASDPNTKLNKLKAATKGFLKVFDPGPSKDRISFVPFNLVGTVRASFSKPQTKPALEAAIDGMQARGLWTNPSDALLEAYTDNDRPNWPTHYVLFTDGAPTAGRLLLADPLLDTTLLPENKTAYSSYDYLHFGVQNSLSFLDGTRENYWSPSPLIVTPPRSTTASPRYLFQYAGGATGIEPPTGPNDSPPCSKKVTDRPTLSQAVFPCLSLTRPTLATHLPEADPATVGGQKPVPWSYDLDPSKYTDYNKNQVFDSYLLPTYGAPGPANRRDEYGKTIAAYDPPLVGLDPERFAHLYYNNTILFADYIRSKNGVVHTIGLGPDSDPAVATDPYQDVANTWARKDYFLERVAAAKKCYLNTSGVGGVEENLVATPFQMNFHDTDPTTTNIYDSGLATWDRLTSLNDQERGYCLLTSDPDDLAMMFTFLAQQLQLRLVEKF